MDRRSMSLARWKLILKYRYKECFMVNKNNSFCIFSCIKIEHFIYAIQFWVLFKYVCSNLNSPWANLHLFGFSFVLLSYQASNVLYAEKTVEKFSLLANTLFKIFVIHFTMHIAGSMVVAILLIQRGVLFSIMFPIAICCLIFRAGFLMHQSSSTE